MSEKRVASKHLVRLARNAARATAKAARAQAEWVDAFREEYGHDEISDALVESIDYAGSPEVLTAEFIEENSGKGD